MWTQVWPIADLQRIDRETQKIMVENGARHPLASTDQLYIPRSSGGQGLKSVESEYKLIKIKAAVKLCANTDPTLKLGCRKGATFYAEGRERFRKGAWD